MKPVEIADPNLRFNVSSIFDDIRQKIFSHKDFAMDHFDAYHQISLRTEGGWFGGIGTLYNPDVGVFEQTKKWNTWNPIFDGSYLQEVFKSIEEIARADGKEIGRARIMRLPPKSCLTLHVDPDEHRYHVPLETNYGCFFVVGTEVHRMLMTGAVYRFKTNVEHTAVNASMKKRTHLVFDTY